MLNRVTSSNTKFLSYDGIAQLVKTVLFSIQTFWAQIFSLCKKIIYAIESIRRKFLWTGNVEASRKPFIAWEKLCWPKASGGMYFLDVFTWNNAAIGKML
uniref:Putative ovule protein n=1 Tax=Solanum chacoense TaxID=4108 RepID=A0A0V0GYM3_SOLCH